MKFKVNDYVILLHDEPFAAFGCYKGDLLQITKIYGELHCSAINVSRKSKLWDYRLSHLQYIGSNNNIPKLIKALYSISD